MFYNASHPARHNSRANNLCYKPAPDHLAVMEDGQCVKVHSDTPHLVSLGSGRLSTAITVHPLHNVRTTIGSPESIIRHDIVIRGTGVDPDHCYIENMDSSNIVLHPIAWMCSVDGLIVDKPTRLTQGCMLCLGRSNFFRFNNPQEARRLKSGLTDTRISMDPTAFRQSLENDPKYMKMVTEPGTLPKHAAPVVSLQTSSPSVTFRQKSSSTDPAKHRDSKEKDNFVNKLSKFETISRRSNPSSPTVKTTTVDSNHVGNTQKIEIRNKKFTPSLVFVGEKFFTKDTVITRVSANLVQGERSSTGSVNSVSSISSHSSQGSNKSQKSNCKVISDSLVKPTETMTTSTNSFEDFLNIFESEDMVDAPILGTTKSGSPRSPKTMNYSPKPHDISNNSNNNNNSNINSNSNNSNNRVGNKDGLCSGNVPLNDLNRGTSDLSRKTFDGLDFDFNDLTECQQELTLKHREVVADRKLDQKQELLERQRLDEILEIFAEYERAQVAQNVDGEANAIKKDVQSKKIFNGKNEGRIMNLGPMYFSKANFDVMGVKDVMPKLNIDESNVEKCQEKSRDKFQDKCRDKYQDKYRDKCPDKCPEKCPAGFSSGQGSPSCAGNLIRSPESQNLGPDNCKDSRNSTKIKTNGSLNMISSPNNQRKDGYLLPMRSPSANSSHGSTSSNSEDDMGSSEDTGTIKRRPQKSGDTSVSRQNIAVSNCNTPVASSPMNTPSNSASHILRSFNDNNCNLEPCSGNCDDHIYDDVYFEGNESLRSTDSDRDLTPRGDNDSNCEHLLVNGGNEDAQAACVDPWDEIIKTSIETCELLNKYDCNINKKALDQETTVCNGPSIKQEDDLHKVNGVQDIEKDSSKTQYVASEKSRIVPGDSLSMSYDNAHKLFDGDINSDSGVSQDASLSPPNSPQRGAIDASAKSGPQRTTLKQTVRVVPNGRANASNNHDSSNELDLLKRSKVDLFSKISELKNQILEMEKQETEAIRDLELERALLESEHQTEICKLQEDQVRIDRLKARQSELIRTALEQKEKEMEAMNLEQTRLKTFEQKHLETEQLLETCSKDDEEVLLERFKREQEVLENQRRFFEDMEFRHLENQSKIEEEKEQINKLLIQEQNNLLARYRQREERLQQIDGQQKDMLQQVKGEIEATEVTKKALINRFKMEKYKLYEIDKKIQQLSQLHDLPYIDDEIATANGRPEITAGADNPSPKLSLLQSPSFDSNRLFMFEKYDNHVIEEHRRRLDELKRRAADEVRAQWEEKRLRELNCKSCHSVESEESSGSCHSDKEMSLSSVDDHLEKLADMERLLVEAQSDKLRIINDQVKLREAEMSALNEERKKREDLEQKLEQETMLREELVQQEVCLREKQKQQARPLTRYLPIRDKDFDLKSHIESAGHHLDTCPNIQVTATCCRGYLHKMGSKFRTWNKRWFVFDRLKRSLMYYADKNETKARGGIYFQSIEEVYVDHLRSTKTANSKLTFCVKTYDRTYYLMAPTAESMRIWIDVIFTGAEGYQQYL